MTVTPHGLRELIAQETSAWLITLRADGSPHTTPVWYVFYRDAFWIASAEKNVKIRNVLHDSRVSVALGNARAPVVAEGSAIIHSAQFPSEVVTAFAINYDCWNIRDLHDGQRVLMEISVTRWLLSGSAS